MLNNIITIEEALKLADPVFIDVRSPKEFAEGKIYGAVNIPLLNDQEREIVGITYKKEGTLTAREQGFSLVSDKLPEMVSQIASLRRPGRELIIYCWRGGLRSKSVVDLLKTISTEFNAKQLKGGYKSYRRHILAKLLDFEIKPQLVVLCGPTGVGKTTILKLLAEKKLPIINLEELANHRGSVFGCIGLGNPVNAKDFDSALLILLEKFNNEPYIVLECESKRIGNIYLPDVLSQSMRNGKRILLTASIEKRISRLMEEYLDLYRRNKPQIMAKVELLRRRMGNKKTDQILLLFEQGDIEQAVKLLLTDYYDPLYGYEKTADSANINNNKNYNNYENFEKHIFADDLKQATDNIADYLKEIEISNKLGGKL